MVVSRSPVVLSCTLRCETISAPLPGPLSIASITRVWLVTVPAAGSGLWNTMSCSPCTILTQSMPVSISRAHIPGCATTAGKVGKTFGVFSSTNASWSLSIGSCPKPRLSA